MTPQELEPIARSLRELRLKPLDLENGFFTCPGNFKHTTPTSPRDCKLYHNPDGTWRFHCQHTSCKEMIDFANFKLSSDVLGVVGALVAARNQKHRKQTVGAISDSAEPNTSTTALAKPRGTVVGHEPLAEPALLNAYSESKTDNDPFGEVQPASKQVSNKAELRRQRRMENALSDIIREFEWPYEEMINDSGGGIDEPVHEHYYQALCQFKDDDIVWCGRDVQDTGSPAHVSRFRPVCQWLAETACPGSFICPSTFKQGVYSRSKEHVLQPKFLVVESDTIDKNQVGALFRWLKTSVGLQLRMVVDTAGKSLHGWFDYPQSQLLQQLKYFLPALGCDPALFNPSQPCRLPGAVRDGHYQKIVYIAD